MDLRKFERVWEKAGERPCCCEDPGCGIRLCFAEADDGETPSDIILWARPEVLEMRGCRVNRQRDGSMFVSKYQAAAIIRDWAVWWLLKRHNLDEAICAACGFDPTCEATLADLRHCADRTEALYLACCKVLGIEP